MILLLDTSTPVCRLALVAKNGKKTNYEWQAGRELAKGLHAFIFEKLQREGCDWHDITGLGVFKGPGSYTGLRIGLTVVNTLADSLEVPIVGSAGDDWQSEALKRLQADEDDQLVLPDYGGGANITAPRK